MTTVDNAYNRAIASYTQHLSTGECNRLRLPTTLSELVSQAQAMGDILGKKGQKGQASFSRAIGEKAILLEPFEKLVEGLCKTSPAAGELIWGSVSFILQMPKSHVKTFDEVSIFFRTMADEIGQIRLQEATFTQSPLVLPVVEALYSAIIDFWIDAVKYYRSKQSGLRSRLKLFAWSPSIDKKFQLLMEEISKQRSRLHDASSAQHNADFASFELRERSANQRRLRDWLNAPDYGSDFRVAIDIYYGGTCEWILKKPSFIQWTSSTSIPTLFIHGIPGAGKTILSSWMIERARRPTADDTVVLYHYFKHTDTDKRTDVSAVRSFIDQLFNHFRCTQHPLLPQLESTLNTASLEQRHTDFSDLWPIFSTTLSSVAQAQVGLRVTVIMDAMDECDSAQKLTTNVLNLAHQIPENLKVLFTGRKSAWDLLDNSLSMSPLSPLELEIMPEDVHHDINTFVRHTISEIPRLAAHKQLRDRLSEVIGSVENHQGMFLWAYFMCEEVKRQGDVSVLRKLLDHLPRGLDAMYQRICKTIAERDEELGLSLSVLRWIVNSPRPLRFPELQEGLRLMQAENEEQSLRSNIWFDVSSDLLWSRQDIVDACGNIVTYSGEGDSFRLVHLSAARFFHTAGPNKLRVPISLSLFETTGNFIEDVKSATPILGQLCLKYLLSGALRSDKNLAPFLNNSFVFSISHTPSFHDDGFSIRHPLFLFAVLYWPEFILPCLHTSIFPTSAHLELLAKLNITAFISDSFNVNVWLETFIRQSSFEGAVHTLRQFCKVDAALSEPSLFMAWARETITVLDDFAKTLSRRPELIWQCYQPAETVVEPSDATQFLNAPLGVTGWMHYDSELGILVFIERESAVIGLKSQVMATGVPMRPALAPFQGPGQGIGPEFVSCISVALKPPMGLSNPAFRGEDTLITPRGIWDLNTGIWNNEPDPIYGRVFMSCKSDTCYSGDGERFAWIKEMSNEVEVLNTRDGAVVCNTKFHRTTTIQGFSHSGQKLILHTVKSEHDIITDREVLCFVVDNGRTIQLEFPGLGSRFSHQHGDCRFTSDEETYVAMLWEVPTADNPQFEWVLGIWSFSRDANKEYVDHATMSYLFKSCFQDFTFCLMPRPNATPEYIVLILTKHGELVQRPLDAAWSPRNFDKTRGDRLPMEPQPLYTKIEFTSKPTWTVFAFGKIFRIGDVLTASLERWLFEPQLLQLPWQPPRLTFRAKYAVILNVKPCSLMSISRCLSSNGKYLVAASHSDGCLIRVFDHDSGKLADMDYRLKNYSPMLLPYKDRDILTVAFSADEDRIGIVHRDASDSAGHDYRLICVFPDKASERPPHTRTTIYLIWPSEDDGYVVVFVVGGGLPLVVETKIKSGDMMKDEAWTHVTASEDGE
ncbi:hypothetical protein DXG01_014918 [Tephrocybe rancida]|nr:hypothetical protein DXG01_014918 [Tephrocybe rancida]